MPRIAVLGATGFTGGLLVRALERRGVPIVAAGRDPDRVERAVAGVGTIEGVRRVDVTEPRTVDDLAADVDVLATTVGPFVELGQAPYEAALRSGCHYLDSAGEQPFVRWAYEHPMAGETSSTLIPACGFDSVPGDLLSAVAADSVEAPVQVHVSYLVRGRGIVVSEGTRRTIGELLPGGGVSYRDGELVDEGFAERRRLAWFPKPVGPHHAAGFPGCEPLMVPRHVPGVRDVGTYFALPTALAEAGQFMARLARFEPVQDVVRRLLTMGPEHPSESTREGTRWGCVAEVCGEGGRIARAWAYGHDIYGFTAEMMALAAERLAAGDSRSVGASAPAQALPAAEVLDELAVVTDLRWSVREPDA